ncbi:hypothetical protein OG292_19070 [Streptomyces sp. NBC_01511]|uniref:hypothetical protein n=1 Tax=unclassified Streptomyces TaxID=2593676 RepID=UPI00386513F2
MSAREDSAAERRREHIVASLREAAAMYEGDARAYLAEHDTAHRAETLAELDRVRAERTATRSTSPLPLGWTRQLDPGDLHSLVSELSAALLGYWHNDPDTLVLDRVQAVLIEHQRQAAEAEQAAATEKASTEVPTATPQPETEPIPLRWGLDDVMYGDDDTTTLLLSGPGGEPYELELDPERTTALRDALAGPEQPQAGVEPAATPDDASAPPYDVLDGEISITGYPPITLSGWRLTELAPDFYGQAYMQIGGWLPKGWPSEDTPVGTHQMAYAHLHGRAVPRDINVQVESKGFGEPRRFLTIQWRKDGA